MPIHRWFHCIFALACLVSLSGPGIESSAQAQAAFPYPDTASGGNTSTVRTEPISPVSGTLSGLILSDAGLPVKGAAISLAGFSTTSGPDGMYTLPVPAGTYTVQVRAYTYTAQSAVDVFVASAAETTLGFILSPASAAAVTGQVTDGSNHVGMPLYARIDVTGQPGGPYFSNPVTGKFIIPTYQDWPLQLTVSAVGGGYLPGTRANVVAAAPAAFVDASIALAVDGMACGAPGYQWLSATSQDFDSHILPSGWYSIDFFNGNGAFWSFTDPGGRGNLTGGSAGFASVDSIYTKDKLIEASLVTDPIGMPDDRIGAFIVFDTDLYSMGNAAADVDVSLDDGSNWVTVWQRSHESVRHLQVIIDITTLVAGLPSVWVRFMYHSNAFNDGWWQVDNFSVRGCTIQAGGRVVGHVLPFGSGGLNGAVVSTLLGSFVSAATPEDTSEGDGLYTAFAPPGEQILTVVDAGVSRSVSVTADQTVHLDLFLNPELVFLPTVRR